VLPVIGAVNLIEMLTTDRKCQLHRWWRSSCNAIARNVMIDRGVPELIWAFYLASCGCILHNRHWAPGLRDSLLPFLISWFIALPQMTWTSPLWTSPQWQNRKPTLEFFFWIGTRWYAWSKLHVPYGLIWFVHFFFLLLFSIFGYLTWLPLPELFFRFS